jgi:hypothetical protein
MNPPLTEALGLSQHGNPLNRACPAGPPATPTNRTALHRPTPIRSQPHPGGGLFDVLRECAWLWVILGAGLAGSAQAQPVMFDFDSGTPPVSTYQVLPVTQTKDGVTATFNPAWGEFSVQTAGSLGGLRLSSFSGRFLAPSVQGSVLEILFDHQMTNISFRFATIQVQPIELETPIELAAYLDSTNNPAVGLTNAAGTYGSGLPPGDSWPMGTLTFNSVLPFNLVRIRVPEVIPTPSTGQAWDFVIDNISVQTAGPITYTITTSAMPASGGTTSGDGIYVRGSKVTVVATPNCPSVHNHDQSIFGGRRLNGRGSDQRQERR